MTSESLANQKNHIELKNNFTEQILNGSFVPVMVWLALTTLLALVAQTFIGYHDKSHTCSKKSGFSEWRALKRIT